MPVFNNILAGAAGQAGGADAGYKIERSLRFDSSSSSYLSRTPSSSGNRKTWTWSGWVKLCKNKGQVLFHSYSAQSDTGAFFIDYLSTGELRVLGWSTTWRATSAVFRDFSAWQHVVVAVDTTNATANDRIKVYVNGSQITDFSTPLNNPGQDAELAINQAAVHHIGNYTSGGGALHDYLDGYLADVHFIDGQQLAATDFGEFSADTGVWNPIAFTGDHNYSPTISYPAVYTTVSGTGNVTDVLGTGNGYYYANAGTTASIRVEFGSPIANVTHVRFTGGGYSSSSTFDIKINGVTDSSANATNSGWSLDEIALSSTANISSFEIVGSDGFSLSNLQFSTDGTTWTTPSGTASLGPTVGVNGFHLDFSDNSSNAALGYDAAGSNDWTVNNLIAESPLSLPGVRFDGSGDYLTVPASADNNFGTGDFTMEWYQKWTNLGGYQTIWSNNYTTALLVQTDTGTGKYRVYAGGNYLGVETNAPQLGKWYHYALVRSGNTFTFYRDGVANGSFTSTASVGDSTNDATIGQGNTNYVNGVISNFRVVKGTAVYSSSFTRPTAPLTNITNTVLLCCQSDTSTTTAAVSPGALAASGDPVAGTFNDSSPANDSLLDSPTNYDDGTNIGGNYATLNPLALYNATLGNGNLEWTLTSTSYGAACPATIAMSTGKFYCEMIPGNNTQLMVGIIRSDFAGTYSLYAGNPHYGSNTYSYYQGDGNKYVGDNGSSYGSSYAEGDVIGIAYDGDNNTITFYKNGVSQGAIDITPDSYHFAVSWGAGSAGGTPAIVNFGQRPFVYPVSGFKSVCTQNLDDPTIADGSQHMDVKTYSGNGGTQDITGLNFSPDLVWIKSRSSPSTGHYHHWHDSVRGKSGGYYRNLYSNTQEAEDTYPGSTQGGISAFNSDGFTLSNPTNGNNNLNTNSNTFVAWTWDGGDLVTNSAYNQSEVWSGFGDSNAKTNENWTHVFNGSLTAAPHVVATSGSTTVWTPSTPITFTKLEIYANNDGYGDITLNGNISTTGTVPSGGGASIGWANVTSLISNNTLTSIEVPNSYNTDPTRLGAIKVDDKYLIDPGVIPVASLNSSAYDQSRTWSNDVSGTEWSASYSVTNGFDNDLSTRAGGGFTFTPPSPIACTKVRIYMSTYAAPANTIFLNGVDISSEISITNQYAVPLEFTPSNNQFVSYQCGNAGNEPGWWAKIELKINGDWVALIDSGVTVDSVPSVPSTVRANPSAGFSIVSFTGDGSGTDTFAHGLNATPDLIILKDRDNSTNWLVYTQQLDGSLDYLKLNVPNSSDTDAASNSSFPAPTSAVFSYGTDAADYIAYCWTAVKNYSSFGTFEGSGSASTAPFVYTGMSPRWIMVKNADIGDSSADWLIYDTQRSSINPVDDALYANRNNAEAAETSHAFDILSNGFKVRSTSTSGLSNGSGNTFIYAAFGDPFKTARAR